MDKKRWLPFILSCLLLLSFTPLKAEITAPTIESGAAILIDANTKTVLYEKNGYEKNYPASITKLMTALLAIENLSPDETITFSKEAIFGIESGSSHIGIDVGEELTVDEALHGLLLMSANEVANGLAESVSGSITAFAIRMTERARELGALNTNFTNPHGLHNDNHYTTAYDMALIGSYLAENEYFLQLMKDAIYEIPPTNKTDEIRYLSQQHKMVSPYRDSRIYREDVIGGKTGYTDQARQTLVTIARRGDTTLVAVVLQSTADARYSDTATLLDYGFDSYHSIQLHTADDLIKTLPLYNVKSGQVYQAANCGLALTEAISVTVPTSISSENITLSFDIPETLDTNVQIGDVVGEVSFVLNSKTLAKSSVVIKQIETLPEPDLTFYGTVSSIPSLPLLIILMIVVIVFIMLIIWVIKKRTKKNKFSKINKLFK